MTGEQKQKEVSSEEVKVEEIKNNQNLTKEINDKKNETDEGLKTEDIKAKDQECQEDERKSIEELQQELDRRQEENDKTYERLLRLQAEYDNFKKRTEREKLAERKYKAQDLANELLPALDNFERALAIETTAETKGIVEGISMVYRQIKEALKSEGIEEIEAVGKEFDPNLHHAVMQVEDEEIESNFIIEELQKGYILKDRVIRPAMVKVNK